MKTISRYIMTLALLLTAVTGAWADIAVGDVFKTGSTIDFGTTSVRYKSVSGNSDNSTLGATGKQTLTYQQYTNGKHWFNISMGSGDQSIYIVSDNTAEPWGIKVSGGEGTMGNPYSFEVLFTEPPFFDLPLVSQPGATPQQWEFEMPGSDVVLTPRYAPTAMFATEGNEVLAPAAAEGVIAGTDAPLIAEGTVAKAGETENPQGTVMYAVTSTNQATAPALTAFSATVPTAKDIADGGAELLVWYYIQGADTPDGQQATADNTFNNSDICATPLTVSVRSNKFDLTLKAANANTIDAGMTSKGSVTVKEGTREVNRTDEITDEGKLEGIKMGSEVKLNTKQGYKFRKVEVKKKAEAAEGHALTSAMFGEIVCSDGKAYAAADKDNLPEGVKAEALVCYVNGEHGLALAMADVKNAKMSWDNDRGANDGKTAAEWCTGWNTSHPITGATWLLASKTQWDNMINAAGSASNLSNAFSAVGGTNLQAFSYWSSTPNIGVSAWRYYFPSSSWSWTYLNQDNTGSYIRACLQW